MREEMKRSDPVGEKYYAPSVTFEICSDVLFWIAAALSIVALQIDRAIAPAMYDAVQTAFVISVIAVFALGLAVKLYWSSRAQTKRIAGFLSHAFDVRLIPERPQGFFNNAEDGPIRRIAASLLENAHFSNAILQRMLRDERAKTLIYALAWLVALLNRATDLALVAAIAQVVLSEQMFSKWIRMEWLRANVERIYDDVYSLIQANGDPETKEVGARVVQCLLQYETAKSKAGISLSSRLFRKMNPSLTIEWEGIARDLHISS